MCRQGSHSPLSPKCEIIPPVSGPDHHHYLVTDAGVGAGMVSINNSTSIIPYCPQVAGCSAEETETLSGKLVTVMTQLWRDTGVQLAFSRSRPMFIKSLSLKPLHLERLAQF